MKDRFGREIEYMRISVTDRCNLRCRYCMPEEGIEKFSRERILRYEEILRICRQAVTLGITRFKITGGEPLVRRGCPELIRLMKETAGVQQVTLTTNGQLLEDHIVELAHGGIDGINISLDSLDEGRYRLMTRGGELEPVIRAIDSSKDAGIKTKVNCLIHRGLNEDEITAFAGLAFEKKIDVRFIEIMPLGFADASRGVPGEEVISILQRQWPDLGPDTGDHGNGPAIYYSLPDRKGSIGIIDGVHGRFCRNCNRIRLTSTGGIRPCLCYDDTVDIMPALREGADADVRETIRKAILSKPAGHDFEERTGSAGMAMSEVGG